MSKAVRTPGSVSLDADDDEAGLDHIPIQRQADGSYHVGDRGGPLGEGETIPAAFHSYALRVRDAIEGADVPVSTIAYHGSLKRPVNYIMVDSEQRPDGSWNIAEVGSTLEGHGRTKTEARIHLAQLVADVANEVEGDVDE